MREFNSGFGLKGWNSKTVFAAVTVVFVLSASAEEASTPKPFVTAPPKLPAMIRTQETLPLEVMNKVLQPLPADAPKPSADPRNFEGVWTNAEPNMPHIHTTISGVPVPLNATGAQTMTRRIEADNAGKPIANAMTSCRPPGHIKELTLNFPFRILQSKNEIDFIFEELHSIWQIRMNQPHRTVAKREYNGDSIGHWDGDTLVVENTDFKLPLWLDAAGTPVSEDGKMTYRMRKIDGGYAMEIIVTVDDPKNYTASWSFGRKMVWRPDRFVAEYNCEKQIGDEAGDKLYGIDGREQ